MKIALLLVVSMATGPAQLQAACDSAATASDLSPLEADNGCSYPACAAGTSVNDWICVYDVSFCADAATFRTAEQVQAAGRVCRCTELLNFPSLIGACQHGGPGGVRSPMVLSSDCAGGSPVCTANADGFYDTGDTESPFTACDLRCFHGQGHAGQIPTGTYQQCEIHAFDWAVTSTGVGSSMAGNNIASTVDSLGHTVIVVGGEIYGDAVKFEGPFQASDPTGIQATSISHSVPVEDVRRPWDPAILMVNATSGTPILVVSVHSPGTTYTHALGVGGGGPGGTNSLVAWGGEFQAGTTGMRGSTEVCTVKVYNDGGAETSCEIGETILRPHQSGWPGYIIAANLPNGSIRWMIQAPWLELSEQELLVGRTLSEHSVLGIQVGSDESLYVTGFKSLAMQEGRNAPSGEGPFKYTGIVAKLNGADGSVVWMKQYPELQFAIKSVLDEAEGAFYFSVEMSGPVSEMGELGVNCDNPASGGGCSLLIRISTANGALHWARVAHGYNARPWESSEVHLAHADDGPYVYVAFQNTGTHGPTSLDSGTSYAGCRDGSGTVTPEYDRQFADVVLDQSICTTAGLGTYFNRSSEFAIPAYAAYTGAHCLGYEATSCLAKFYKNSGLPVWGSTKQRVHSFVPQNDSITSIGQFGGTAVFDTVVVGGPRGQLDGYTQNWISRLTLDGEGLSVQNIHAERSYSGGPAIIQDSKGNLFATFYFAASRARLGPGRPGGWILDTETESGCDPDAVVCANGDQRVTVVKLGALYTPSCIVSCETGIESLEITPGTCFVEQICYEDGETAAFVGAPCMMCDARASQTSLTTTGIGTEFCLIDGICFRTGDARPLVDGRRIVPSECEFCRPSVSSDSWTLESGYELVGAEMECRSSVSTAGPVPVPTPSPGPDPTSAPIPASPPSSPVTPPSTTTVAPTIRATVTSSAPPSSYFSTYKKVHLVGVVIGLLIVGTA